MTDSCAGLNPTLDGHAALAYDTLSAFINASSPGTQPVAVHLVSKLNGIEFSGASGVIDFKNSKMRGAPEDKFIAVMTVDPTKANGGARISSYCGRLPADVARPAGNLCAG